MVPKGQPTREIAKIFWNNLVKTGRVNELKFSLSMYFKDGFVQGIKNALAMQSVGLGLVKAGRLNPMELFGGHKCKDSGAIKKMIAKAREIEDRRHGLT
jgi:quinone-modifying oxidoreductase subunit QmoC